MTGTGTRDVTAGDPKTTLFGCCCDPAVAAPLAEGGVATFVVFNAAAAAVSGVAVATIRAGTVPVTGMGMVVADEGMDPACVAQLVGSACMVVVVAAAAAVGAAGDFMLTSVVALTAADATVAAVERTGCVNACA